MRALAVTAKERMPILPDVPTTAAAGLRILVVPAGTPKEIIARLNEETVKILRNPKMVDGFSERGVRFVGNDVATFTASIVASAGAGETSSRRPA